MKVSLQVRVRVSRVRGQAAAVYVVQARAKGETFKTSFKTKEGEQPSELLEAGCAL